MNLLAKGSLTFWILMLFSLASSAQVLPKYGVFIYSFAKNLQWPDDNREEFIIGILDHEALKIEMDQATISKQIGAKKIIIKSIKNFSEVASCHILFLASSQSTSLPKVLQTVSSFPVLVIAESSGLARDGAAISFNTEAGKFRFEYNLEAIESRGIKMPGNLKSLGIKVEQKQ
jgi:hypothetical protein